VRSNNKLLKIFLLVLTLVLFVAYYLNNQESFARISDLSILEVFLILIGQSLILLANTLTLHVIVSFFQKKIHFTDAARVTAYSSLINFFGFLQGGVGFRGVYLKKYFSIPLKKYFLLTSVQYLLLFSLAGTLIFTGVSLTSDIQNAVLLTLLGLGGLGLALLVLKKLGVVSRLTARFEGIGFIFHSQRILLLACATALQLTGSFIAYGVALNAIGAHVTLGGLLIFTGISQFSIVIALTPGALGIREGLLLIAQSQMLLTSNDIIVASTIDRIVYFITLGLLVPFALGARNKIQAVREEP
jgi:uncharacterized membrane protein YbhN (UPF0104 family)